MAESRAFLFPGGLLPILNRTFKNSFVVDGLLETERSLWAIGSNEFCIAFVTAIDSPFNVM